MHALRRIVLSARTQATSMLGEQVTDPAHIQKAKAEFDQKRGAGFVYKTRLADRKPPLDYRK